MSRTGLLPDLPTDADYRKVALVDLWDDNSKDDDGYVAVKYLGKTYRSKVFNRRDNHKRFQE